MSIDDVDLTGRSDDEIERLIHRCIEERMHRAWDDPDDAGAFLTQWILVGHIWLPPTGDDLGREDYIRLFSDRNLPSHQVLGLLAVLDAQTRAHAVGPIVVRPPDE